MAIPQTLKTQIFSALIRVNDLLGAYNEFSGVVEFLNFIWPLRDMSSTDDRFSNAWDEVKQHMVNNNDWTLEYALRDRFRLLEGDEENFVKFLETVVSPVVRRSRERIVSYVTIINSFLSSTTRQLKVVDHFEDLPVYKFRGRYLENVPLDITPNKYIFYVVRLDNSAEIRDQTFRLEYDNWNDFGLITQFRLTYCRSGTSFVRIGNVKIMAKGENVTWDVIPPSFSTLPPNFCSLGQSEQYYDRLKEEFPTLYKSILLALRDVAFFPGIREDFETESIFSKSLTREDDTEQLMRTIKLKLFGMDLSTAFKFGYKYRAPFADEPLNIHFDFEYEKEVEHRIYALIGKNGTGKTRLLGSIAKDLSNPQADNFFPRKPVYAKIFSVSYSFFDQHDIPEPDPSFNYVYCGLKKPDKSWLTNEELRERFFSAIEKIRTKGKIRDLHRALKNFVPHTILDVLFVVGTDEYSNRFLFDHSTFLAEQYKLSSGQSILLYIITEIVAHIRHDSLILYDEPETHLHPNAISSLINTLFSLVYEYKSFCILGTHSPLIIQEIHARDVFILDRNENISTVRTLSQESFAENLGVITDEIFGNRDMPRHYIEQLRKLVREGKSYDEIVKLLEPDEEIALSLNAKLFIKSLIAQQDEKP